MDVMNTDREHVIREQAYLFWLDEGCPEGRADAHWERAVELIEADTHALQAAPASGTKRKAQAKSQSGQSIVREKPASRRKK
jgi:hypothetical protein